MKFSFFLAKRVALGSNKTFSRLIIRIAIVAVALSMTVMIASTALIAGFKKEISGKIFGFWGHIHITKADLSRSLLEVEPVSKDQYFYPSLDTLGPVEYIYYGDESQELQRTNGGVRHIQVFAIQPGIIKSKEEIEGVILKGIDRDFDWEFLEKYLVAGEPLDLTDTVMSSEILISQQTADRINVELGDRFQIHFVQKG